MDVWGGELKCTDGSAAARRGGFGKRRETSDLMGTFASTSPFALEETEGKGERGRAQS